MIKRVFPYVRTTLLKFSTLLLKGFKTAMVFTLTTFLTLAQKTDYRWHTYQPKSNDLYSAHLLRWRIQHYLVRWVILGLAVLSMVLAFIVAIDNPFENRMQEYYFGTYGYGSPLLTVCCLLVALTLVQTFRLLNAKTRPLDE